MRFYFKVYIKKIFKKLLLKYRLVSADEWHIADIYAKEYGVKFGRNVRITGKISFSTEPYLIEIGDNVTLTEGIVFHTHDG